MRTIWRISNYRTLDGSGGLRFSGRWHNRGRQVVYCSEHAASALLEILVHLDRTELPQTYQLLQIAVNEPYSLESVDNNSLPEDWKSNFYATRRIGDAWLSAGSSLLLRVPSVIIPHTWNILFNPAHPDFAKAQITSSEHAVLDSRLI